MDGRTKREGIVVGTEGESRVVLDGEDDVDEEVLDDLESMFMGVVW